MNTIYSARRILTMNPSRPQANHVAVSGDRILGVGTLEELTRWGEYVLDERFADKVLMPGLVEGHSHTMEGAMWRYVYCGFFDRTDPDGKTWPGLQSIEEVVERLRAAADAQTDPDAPVSGWSLDPIYYDGPRVTREDLDQASAQHPIGVMHASGHILNVNSAALAKGGLLRTGVDHPGIVLGTDGLPTGELKGPEAMAPVARFVGFGRAGLVDDEAGLRDFARLCVRSGVTTATDLASPLPDDAVAMMTQVTGEADFPTRIVALRRYHSLTPADYVERLLELSAQSTDRLRLGMGKVVADGSIQGFSARLRWPGYFNGSPNGLWYVPAEQLEEVFRLALQQGVQIHTHTNGDEATELVLDCIERGLRQHPARDHRFTLQHCQLADAAQFRRMRSLDMCVNLFPNHHYYWGDQHYDITVGPERAERMNACATALAAGVPMAIHSDAPVTPLGPLFTAWCAINRRTASGRQLGEHECIGIDDALRTITLGAAYTLRLDAEIGSIEVGKKADFAVLEEDPYEAGPQGIKDVGVWCVVQGGRPFSAAEI